MVAYTDVARASALLNELSSINTALKNIESGGEIVTMEVSSGTTDTGGFTGVTAKVATEYMHPPPQMMTAVKQLLEQRQQEILKELTDMGITGLEGQQSVKRTTRR